MADTKKTIGDSALHLADIIIKLSTALLAVPVPFLVFVSEMGLKAHPDALLGLHPVSDCLKLAIVLPLGLSIVVGLITHYVVMKALREDISISSGRWPRLIMVLAATMGILFVIGGAALTYLIFQFPIEIPEPFRPDSSPLS